MSAQIYLFEPSTLRLRSGQASLRAGGERLMATDVASTRPLRWAAWHPDGSWCLLVGNGGTALRYDPSTPLRASGKRVEPIETGVKHNLRGAAFSPDGEQALLVGNQG